MGLAKTMLAIGIAFVYALFIGYGLFVIYEPPEADHNARNVCWEAHPCHDLLGQCRNVTASGTCHAEVQSSDEYKQCRDAQEACNKAATRSDARFKNSRVSFWILLFLGVASIIGGVYLSKFEGIGSGFIGGGVLVLIWNLMYTSQYWVEFDKVVKLIIIGIVLALLVYVGYKKLDKS